MRHQATIQINPSVMRWVLESSGWQLPEIAHKLEVTEKTLLAWEKGSEAVPIKKLEQLAAHLKRPLAAFLLPQPPKESEIPDYRKIAGIDIEPLSKEARLAIRKSTYLQSVAKDLMSDLGIPSSTQVFGTATIRDNPYSIASRERKRLRMDELMQTDDFKSITQSQYLYELRRSIESQNILVFQMKIPIKDARGFSLSDNYPYSIVINSSDAYSARIFTLMHEFAHIILKESGICSTNAETVDKGEKIGSKVERWCNSFAASILLPEHLLLQEFDKVSQSEASVILTRLSSHFKVSKHAILIQIHNLNLIDDDVYKKELEVIAEKERKEKEKKEKKKEGGFVSPVKLCMSERGNRFISLVMDSQKRGLIHYGDVNDYLGIKLKHFDKLMLLL